MQKSKPINEIQQWNFSLTVDCSAGDFRVFDCAAEVSISCVSEVSSGICIGLCEVFPSCGRSVSVSSSGRTVYGIVEVLAEKFTAVVYGFIRSFRSRAVRVADRLKRIRILPVRCRMVQLSFAGGLRL